MGETRGHLDLQPPPKTMINFVFYASPSRALICLPAGTPVRYSVETAADLAGLSPDIVRYYCQTGLLGAAFVASDVEPTFDADALFALRRIEHYRRHHGVNRQALPLLCALERDVERLEKEVRFLRGP